jgi:uroporphyrinogen decarboxylase
MKSKERVLSSLNWNEPDRVPIHLYTTPEIEKLLSDYFKGRDILDCLGVDFRYVIPAYKGKIRSTEAGIKYDLWGCGYRTIKSPGGAAYEEVAVLPFANLKTLDDVEKYPWPDPNDFDYSNIEEQCHKFEDFAVCTGDAGFPDITNGISRGRGMEQVLTDIALRNEVGLAIIDKRVKICYQILLNTLEAANGKIDIVCLGEDCGNQNGRMFSPRDFNEIFKPRLQKFYNLAHDFGAKAMMHSCGDTHELMPDFIDMRLDILDAMQPEPAGMNPEKIRKICKGKLAFCGLISTQQTLPFGTVHDCRKEARHRLDVIAKGGGYIFSPAHCIQPDTPIENILAVYEEALSKKL